MDDLTPISGLLEYYKKKLAGHSGSVEQARAAIREATGIEIPSGNIVLSKNELRLRISAAEKNEVFMRKKEIISILQKQDMKIADIK